MPLKPSNILVHHFLLLGQLLLQLVSHTPLLFYYHLVLTALLGHIHRSISILQLSNLVFVHFYFFVSIGQLLCQHLIILLALKDALPLFLRLRLLVLRKLLFDCFLYFYELSLQLTVLKLKPFYQLILRICLR